MFYGRRSLLQIVFGVFAALRQRMITLRDIAAGGIQRLQVAVDVVNEGTKVQAGLVDCTHQHADLIDAIQLFHGVCLASGGAHCLLQNVREWCCYLTNQ